MTTRVQCTCYDGPPGCYHDGDERCPNPAKYRVWRTDWQVWVPLCEERVEETKKACLENHYTNLLHGEITPL
jgi:hypothetical protein